MYVSVCLRKFLAEVLIRVEGFKYKLNSAAHGRRCDRGIVGSTEIEVGLTNVGNIV